MAPGEEVNISTPMRWTFTGCGAATPSSGKRRPVPKVTMSPTALSLMVESSQIPVCSPCIARGLFSDGEEPYDRRRLPTRLPVGGGDRVLIVQDSQALEGFEQLVTLVTEELALHAPPVEVAMEPLDHEEASRLQRLNDFLGVARKHGGHVHPPHQIPPLPAVVEAVRILDDGRELHPSLLGRLPRQLDADVRDIEARDLPPLGGEEEGIAPLPDPDVERRAGPPVLDPLCQELVVWECTLLALGVHLVPDFSRWPARRLRLDQTHETQHDDDDGFAHQVSFLLLRRFLQSHTPELPQPTRRLTTDYQAILP